MEARLNVLFIGMDHPYAFAVLDAIAGAENVVAVIESRSRKQADDHPKRGSYLAKWSAKRGLPYQLLFRDSPSAASFIRASQADVIVVAGMGRKMSAYEFAIPRFGAINLHPSLLPNYRGPEPILWQYLQFDLRGGMTIHQIDAGLDTGDILLQHELPIGLGEPMDSTLARLANLGATMAVETLTSLRAGTLARIPQRDLPCPVFARFTREGETLIDWNSWSIEHVWHVLRGVQSRYELLPPPMVPRDYWVIGSIERGSELATSGTIARDANGYYVAHRDGRIRLRLERHSLIRRILGRIKRWLRR